MGAIITPGGTKGKELPGLYIHLEAGAMMVGGGAYFLDKEPLYQVRQHIIRNPQHFKDIINHPDFKAHFEDGIRGEQNKKLPVEFQEAAVNQPLLYNKQFYVMAELDPQNALGENAIELVLSHYHALKPLNDFLIEALMPN